ncbi:MAG: molybdopterin-dependent oxidoreductase [Chloroflexi bacterium]|nr:molybdopterin-dependent oxidoreductase [Chloroflexota bacterium]
MIQEITLQVNGRTHCVHVEPDTPLLYVLRNDLGLKGATFACGLEQCGACTIILDGRAVPSCRMSVRAAQGREITTIEGLGTAGDLHSIQKAFIEEQAVQCGFCTPGIIVAATAMLDRNPHPTDTEIQVEMAQNLCRCGVYDRALRAIKRAAGRPSKSPLYEVKIGEEKEFPSKSHAPTPTDALPHSLIQTPDLDSWVRINTDGTITLLTGKVELGQDIKTSVAMIGADELDVSLERIQVVTADTAQSPDEGYTVSSMSLETTGNAIRYATAEVRQIALSVAHEELEAPTERLTVTDGTITDPVTGRNVTYWDLFAGKRFGCRIRGVGQPKRPDAYRIVGRPAERLDLLAKVTGDARFVHDLDLPDMVHGRVVRPPRYRAKLVAMDAETVRQMPGVIQVVRDGDFLAIIAEREEQAVWAVETLRKTTTWENGAVLPPQETLFDHILHQPDQAFLVVDGAPVDNPIPPIQTPAEAAHTLTATYCRPYQMHASLGPSAAVAQLIDGKLTVWTHSQGVYPLRAALAHVLAMPEDDIRAIHAHGPGCFGHNGADDAALDAALLARASPGRPVSLKWARADEHTWEPYGPATVIEMQASLNTGGDIINWNHDVWGYTHIGRARSEGDTSGLLAASHLAEPFAHPQAQPRKGPHVGIHRNADPLYALPQKRIVKHFLPDSPLRTSALRGLGFYANIFAIESFVDELAHAAGADPVEFRLRHLADERARDVIQAAAQKVGWQPRECPQNDGRGRGIAFSRYKNRQSYVAVFVDLSVNRASGHIRLERATLAVDAGQIVNPDGLSNQLEGAFIQSASWTLKEHVTFDSHGITSTDWHSYPILRFHDAPEIETVLLNRPGLPYLGIGEAVQGPIPAAIANAVFDAVGIRLRQIPFKPGRVKASLGIIQE